MPVGRAFADGERVGIGLEQRPVAESGYVLLQVRHRRSERRHGQAFHLRLARFDAGVAPQPRENAHGHAEHAVVIADETYVTVVELGVHGHREAQADAPDEVLVLVAVEDDGVQHAHRVTAGVEIQPQRERQPGARAARMFAFDLDDGAHRPALFERHFFDGALEAFLFDHRRIAAGRAVLARQHEFSVAQYLAVVAHQYGDDVRTSAVHAAFQNAGVDLDGIGALGDGERFRRLRRAALRHDFEGTVAAGLARCQRMGGPLERAVGPEGERP